MSDSFQDIQLRKYRQTLYRSRNNVLMLVVLLLFAILISLLAGRYPQPGIAMAEAITGDPMMLSIIRDLRLPRVLLAIFGGAMLACAGFVFQLLFANPLVEPGFLGVSQGASFGAAATIVFFGYSPILIQVSATFFGLAALVMSYLLAKKFTFGGWILRLVLSGIAVGAFFSSALSIVKLAADPSTSLQDITFWMMGGLYNSTWKYIVSVLPITVVSMMVLLAFRWRINVLSLDDRTAHSIGLSPAKEKALLLFIATVGTTAVVAVSGIVSWIGLIIPHVSRRLFGSDSRFSLIGSMLLGALFMLVCDTLGRTLFFGELPLGVLTSIIGAMLFVLLLSRKKSGVHL